MLVLSTCGVQGDHHYAPDERRIADVFPGVWFSDIISRSNVRAAVAKSYSFGGFMATKVGDYADFWIL